MTSRTGSMCPIACGDAPPARWLAGSAAATVRRWPARLYRISASVAWLAVAGTSHALEEPAEDDLEFLHLSRFVVGVAVGLERFDTNMKQTDKASGQSTYVDGEGSFNLQPRDTIPILYGAMRLGRRHGIGFHAFRISRDGSRPVVQQDFGRLTVDGRVYMSDHSSFSYVNYQYRLMEDENMLLRGLVGVYAIDLDMTAGAVGTITLGQIPVAGREYETQVKELAPLPLVGLDFWAGISERWAFGSRLAVVGGTYDNVSAFVVEAGIRARYQLSRHTALILGAHLLDAEVTVDKSSRKDEISYGYDGVFVGFDVNF